MLSLYMRVSCVVSCSGCSGFLLVCALARPEYLSPPQIIQKPMRDMVLILDVSGSMSKTDVEGGITRLKAVQNSVQKFVDARKSDRIGMVIFASSAWPFAPVSEDKQALKIRINQLTPGMVGQQTAIGDGVGVAVKLLEAGTDETASKLAILLTDGNDTASQLSPALAAKLAASHQVVVHTIAFGDPDSSGDDKVDLPLLQEIARTTHGKSWTAANSGAALDSVWQEIDAITPVQVKSIGWSWHVPLFAWPLVIAMGGNPSPRPGTRLQGENCMSDFHFLYPWRLLGLLLCLALWAVPVASVSAWQQIMDKPFARALVIGKTHRLTRVAPWLFALGVVALAGPSWQRELPATLTPQSNVMVILQQDLAMYAQDMAPSRQARMQSKLSELMKSTPGTRYGLVVYNAQAFLTTPLTQDPNFSRYFCMRRPPRYYLKARGQD
ncbi:BatA (Bacteroides aerotolerance operon) [Lelliottia amnigena]|nr:BatA (Bacteroides aerotolerance operon) [Lelliottia amnigena]